MKHTNSVSWLNESKLHIEIDNNTAKELSWFLDLAKDHIDVELSEETEELIRTIYTIANNNPWRKQQ